MGLKAPQAAISFIEDGDIFYYDEAVEQDYEQEPMVDKPRIGKSSNPHSPNSS